MMEWSGKQVHIYLSTPLFPADNNTRSELKKIQGKILDRAQDGFWIQIAQIGDGKTTFKFPYATIFLPTYKIDYMAIGS